MERSKPDLWWTKPGGIPDREIEIVDDFRPDPILGWSIGRIGDGGRIEFYDGPNRRWFTGSIKYNKGIKQNISGGTLYQTKEAALEIIDEISERKVSRPFAVVKQDKAENELLEPTHKPARSF